MNHINNEDAKAIAEAVLAVLDDHSFIGASMFCLTDSQRKTLLNTIAKQIEQIRAIPK